MNDKIHEMPRQTGNDRAEICESPAGSLDEARSRASKLIYSAWPQIVAGMVREAENGSVPHAKFLLECENLSVAKTEAKNKKEDATPKEPEKEEPKQSLAQLLIDTLCAFDRGELN